VLSNNIGPYMYLN